MTVLLQPSVGDKDWRVFPPPQGREHRGEKEKLLFPPGSGFLAGQRPAFRAVWVGCPLWVPCSMLEELRSLTCRKQKTVEGS